MSSSNSNSYPSFGPSSKPSPKCLCGEKYVVRTVKKETLNKGRKFWRCRYFMSKDDPGCSYMKWTSDPWPPQTRRQTQSVETRAETQHGETKCADCVQKEIEIVELRKTIKEMKKDGESTENLLKIALNSIFLLVVACVMLIVKAEKSV